MKDQKNQSNEEIYSQILAEISEIKKQLDQSQSIGDWITRKQAMAFLGYRNTAMRELEKNGEFTFSQVGRNKFYLRTEIMNFLSRNIQHQNLWH
jgi:hypothetical protein